MFAPSHHTAPVDQDIARSGPTPSHNGVDGLLALLADDMHATNQLIIDRMHSKVALIPQLAGYLVASGGKRIRPLLTLASARLCGYGQADIGASRHQGLAACVEFIHTATLLHDDVVDDSQLRRGRSSANAVFGNQASVLVGDFLFSRAFELMVADGSLEVLRILSHASSVIAEGEVLQLSVASQLGTTRADYLEVISGKTAALFAAACEVGAVVADRPKAEQEALRNFGQHLGIAFQLVDDVLDYSAEQAKLGKEIGNDLREGKMTLPVIVAIENAATAEDKAFWQRVMELGDIQEGDLEKAIALMEQTGALQVTMDEAKAYANKAEQDLALFADSAVKSAMLDALHYTVTRDR
jgi:octaprenyl-diphosphate synthase